MRLHMPSFRIGAPIKQPPPRVEVAPTIRSVNINGEKYLHYGDVIEFLMDEHVIPELRWALDQATFWHWEDPT